MNKNTTLIFIFLLGGMIAVAQNNNPVRIETRIWNAQQAPLENITAELRKSADSSLVKVSLSDKSGLVLFEQVTAGNYFIKTTAFNYNVYYTENFSVTNGNVETLTVPKIILQPAVKQLGDVTVTTKKPFIQKLSDRIVVNVENSVVSAGSSAMDVLERSPGVNIDQNENISLRGKAGVIIMIDGKPTPMTGADLASYLKGLPSAALDRIDIITNPSSKYDAAGNSGIIDIRMKKDQRLGANGTFTTGYGQGVYPKTSTGLTFNFRNKKINVFGNYNYAYRIGLNHLLLDRNFYEDGIYDGGDLKDNYSKSPVSSNTARIGMDFFPSKKTIIGFVINGNFNHYTRKSNNSSIVLDPQRERQSTFQSTANNNDHAKNGVANINFKHSFGQSGKEITADADYGEYNSTSLTRNATQYYKLDGTSLQPNYILDGDQDGKLVLRTAKVDYVNPLEKNAKWETGFKTSYVSSDNDAQFFDVSNGTPVNDIHKTNHFLYKEYNNAGYLNFSKQFKHFDLQLGLRGEHTTLKTNQEIGNVSFDSSYFKIFPSAFFNYKLKEDKTIGLSVSKRIDRPGYSSLNPFLFLIDVTTYATGNPSLLPQFTWSYELSYTVKNINMSVSYSRTTNNQNITLARFKEVFPAIASPADTNVTVQIPINLSSSDYWGFTISAPIRVTKWWNMINNADVYYQEFHGDFSGTSLNNGKPAADIRTNNTFALKNGWTAELNGSLNTGGRDGFMVSKTQWGISAGAQKLILKNKGTLRLNVTDIFWTNLPRATITYNNYIEKWRAYRETRVVNLTFSYRFGNSKIQAARRRSTASEEERQRAQ
jgi:iron complex outermembrane receptor protein